MKLLFVLPEYPPDFGGGIATHYAALLPRLAARGHTVNVIVGSAMVTDRPAYQWDGVNVSVLESERFKRFEPLFSHFDAMPGLKRSLAAAWAVHEQAGRGEGYDAVEVVDWGLSFVPWLATKASAPVRVQLHGSSGQIAGYDSLPGQAAEAHVTRLIEASALRAAPLLATSSRANQAAWEAVTGRDVLYGPPPVRPPAPLAVERGPRGFVAARLQEWKGPETLCAALEKLGHQAPVVEWAGRSVVHPGTGEAYQHYLARTYPGVWETTLKPLGPLAPAEVAQRQRAAAFVVVPSRWDVFNLSVAEAMLHESVVICSDGAGGVDLVEDGRTGFTFPAGDADALAAVIRSVSALTSETRREVGAAARREALARLDPEALADAWISDLDRLANAESVLADFTADTMRPSDPSRPYAFCDHLPIRDLGRYLARRVWGTTRNRFNS